MSDEPIPFIDLVAEQAPLRDDLVRALTGVLDSGRFVGGPQLTGFEQELAGYVGVKSAIGVSSGTDALLVSLMAHDIGPGDEVITTPFTFFATAGCIARLGAKPVFVDIEADSYNLDPAAVTAAITPQTKAIIPVHLYGRQATLAASDIPIIEDAAQSLGAGPVRGASACISFFPTKNLGALGDGGAVLTDDDDLAERIRRLRNHGAKPKYFHAMIGGNFRLDPIQAAILRIKLKHLDAWNRTRRAHATRYRELFAHHNIVSQGVTLPSDTPEHIYHQFVIRTMHRNELKAHLASAGIATEVYYPQPLHLQACFAELGYQPGSLPKAEAAAEQVLALPIRASLTSREQERIVQTIADFVR